MSDVLSGLLWLTLRAFLPPGALLRFRTTASYWNDGNKFGPYGDLFIFLLKSGGEDTNTTSVKNCVSVSLWDLQATYVWSCITCMKAVLSGEAWVNVRRGLLPDDVVNLRVTAKCWNNGQLYGDLGVIFFMLLKMKQYTFYESGREPMQLRNPVLETIRRHGLDSMVGSTPEDTSLRDILTT